jgi:Flp pilus assembly protein TadB
MNDSREQRRLTFETRGGWLQRVVLALVGASLAILAFFFITVAVIAAAFIALAIGVRWWWVMRRLRSQAKAAEALEGEYTVVEIAPSIERDPPR